MYLRVTGVSQRYYIAILVLLGLCNIAASLEKIVVLRRFSCPLNSEWYFVAANSFTSNSSQVSRKKLSVNCGPLSVKNLHSTLNFATQSLMKMVASIIFVVFVVGVAFVSFKNMSVVTVTDWLPVFVFSRGPCMTMPIYVKSPAGGSRCSLHCLFDIQ